MRAISLCHVFPLRSVNHQSAPLADVKSTLHHLQHFIWLYEISGSLEKRGEEERSKTHFTLKLIGKLEPLHYMSKAITWITR